VRIRPVIVIVTLSLSAALLTGCSTTTTLDLTKLQDGIATGLTDQVGGEWTVVCPEGQAVAKGTTFECQVTSKTDGTTATIKVTEDDDQGNVTWETLDTAASAAPSASPAVG
jgi:uncharacterized lipoprotein YmbA